MLLGADISMYQNSVNLEKLSTRARVIILKATEGPAFVDPTFKGRWAALHILRKPDLVIGAYHFAHPSAPAKDQANHFVDTVKPRPEDRLVVDVEVEGGRDTQAWVRRFRRHVRFRTISLRRPLGKACWVYSDNAYFERYMPITARFGRRNWKAAYGSTPTPRFAAHQFTDKYSFPGVTGPCDASHWSR